MITEVIAQILNAQGQTFLQQGQPEEVNEVHFICTRCQVIFNLVEQCLWCSDSTLLKPIVAELNQRLHDEYFEIEEGNEIAFWKRNLSTGI